MIRGNCCKNITFKTSGHLHHLQIYVRSLELFLPIISGPMNFWYFLSDGMVCMGVNFYLDNSQNQYERRLLSVSPVPEVRSNRLLLVLDRLFQEECYLQVFKIIHILIIFKEIYVNEIIWSQTLDYWSRLGENYIFSSFTHNYSYWSEQNE